MSGMVALVGHSLRRGRALLATVAAVMFAFQMLLVLVAASFHRTQAFDRLAALVPDFARPFLGSSGLAALSFTGIVCAGYFHPALMGGMMALAITSAVEPAGEIERRFTDLVLSRPQRRHVPIARSAIVMCVAIAISAGAMIAGTVVGLDWLAPADAPRPSRRVVLSLAANLSAVGLCWGGVALAIASLARRRAVAGGIAAGLTFVAFLLDYLARAWAPARRIAWLSPFHYYDATGVMLSGATPWRDLAILLAVTIAAVAAAHIIFARRDL
jgi:ABC-2 type transport system permease protein